MSTTELIDRLRSIADQATKEMERLEEDNERMRSSAIGVLPDGTPVQDVLDELKDAKAEVASLHRKLRAIRTEAGTGSSAAYTAIKRIRSILES